MKIKIVSIGVLFVLLMGSFSVNAGCIEKINNQKNYVNNYMSKTFDDYNINRTLSDDAQRNTLAFDALAFLTGNLGAQSFFPPGKVADFSGFQYLRDNDPTKMGHNTDFVTIIAFNVLHILTKDQINQLINRAQNQIDLINQYAYRRFPLMDAFRRLLEGDVPQGSTGLDMNAIKNYSAGLYRIDGFISYDRAQLLGSIYRSLSPEQKSAFEALASLNGVGNWNRNLSDPLQDFHLDQDVQVAVMTYASEMYSWVMGSVEADTYFCPERQGTYFGSFYLKDGPVIGNPNVTINESLTASAGQDFLKTLTESQVEVATSLVSIQRNDLYEIVETRQNISTQLRRFMTQESLDYTTVMNLAEKYGELDGEIIYYYATHFAAINQSLNNIQRTNLGTLVTALKYKPPTGAFLYSQPIDTPQIISTDFLFGVNINLAPEKPKTPNGTTSGEKGKEYNYTSSTFDPEFNQLYFLFDWGDGTISSWLGPYYSGEDVSASHVWGAKGNYSVRVKARDSKGAESEWSDSLPITMPYSYNQILQFLELLFQRFPHAFPILRHMLGY
jgi:hypothetical protein